MKQLRAARKELHMTPKKDETPPTPKHDEILSEIQLIADCENNLPPKLNHGKRKHESNHRKNSERRSPFSFFQKRMTWRTECEQKKHES
jgi:hypothetical protein